MQGQVTLEQSGELSDIEFVVTIESQDVQFMIEKDPKHQAKVVGNVTCLGLSPEPLVIQSGIAFFGFVALEYTPSSTKLEYFTTIGNRLPSYRRYILPANVKI